MSKRTRLASLLLTLTVGVSACAQAPAPVPAAPVQDTAAIEATMKTDVAAWFAAYNKADGDGMASQYTEDALLMPPGAGAVSGRAAIKTFLGDDSAKSKAAGISMKNGPANAVGISGDMAWLSGTYTVVDAKGTTLDTGKYLSVHKRTNGAWLYVRDTWNSDTPPPPPPPVRK